MVWNEMKGIYWDQLVKTIMTQRELKKKLKTENNYLQSSSELHTFQGASFLLYSS